MENRYVSADSFASFLHELRDDVRVSVTGDTVEGGESMTDTLRAGDAGGYLQAVLRSGATGEPDVSDMFGLPDPTTIESVDDKGELFVQPAMGGSGIDYRFTLELVDSRGSENTLTFNGEGVRVTGITAEPVRGMIDDTLD